MSIKNYPSPSKILPSHPLFFNLAKKEDEKKLEQLTKSGKVMHVSDVYYEQLKELFAINNPALALKNNFEKEFKTYYASLIKKTPEKMQGTWVFFPWLFSLVHILNDVDFQKVRTGRNRNLITEEEQKKFYSAVIGIAGLSVGNSAALAIVLQGGARHIKLADHDTLELSNLNRIRAGVDSLGIPKVEITARQIYLLNPYTQIDLFPDGLTEKNIDSFFDNLDMVIDEIDDLPTKYRIREYARRCRVPVLMGIDNDQRCVIDVERYDFNENVQFFKQRLGNISYKELTKLDKRAVGALIAKLIGSENMTPRILNSLNELGRVIVSWPQLGATALMNGSLLANCVLRIANAQPLTDARVIVSMDTLLKGETKQPYRTHESESTSD